MLMFLGSFTRKYLDASGTTVVGARATQKGDVSILLDKGSNKEGFAAEVTGVVGVLGVVKADPKKVTLENRDLDPLASEKKVLIQIKRVLQNEQTKPEVKVLNPNQTELKLAVVVLPEDKAVKLKELLPKLAEKKKEQLEPPKTN